MAACRELLADGTEPTVERAADRAGVSRTTAYRYFPKRHLLVAATYPEINAPSLLTEGASDDPAERLDAVIDSFSRQLLEHEQELRAQLRLSLAPGDAAELPLRQGRAIGWIEDALAPLEARLGRRGIRRLALAIRATLGIEALVWLTDVGGVSGEEAVEIMAASARALLAAALA